MKNEETERMDTLLYSTKTHQIQFVYYVMALSAAAIAYVMTSLDKGIILSQRDAINILCFVLPYLAVFSWSMSFYFGYKQIQNIEVGGILNHDYLNLGRKENKTDQQFALYQQKGVEMSAISRKNVALRKGQLILLLVGFIIYFGFHVVKQYFQYLHETLV